MNAENNSLLNLNIKSTCLTLICKNNLLAAHFLEKQQGMDVLNGWLKKECQSNDQVAYNTIALLWIVSAQDVSLKYFRDYDRRIVENLFKVLDFHNKEKIIRIFAMLIDVSIYPLSN